MNKDMADFYRFATVKSEFFKANYPAWTTVGTTDLVRPEDEVEIKINTVSSSGENIRLQLGKKRINETAD